MTDIPPGDADAFEELLQFLYLTPVGIVKFAADGTVELMNPVASQLLQPLVPANNLENLFDLLAPLVPDLRQLVAEFTADTGAIMDQRHLETSAGASRRVLSLTVHRVNEKVYMAVLEDVTKLAEQERNLYRDQQRLRAIFDNVRDYCIYTMTPGGVVEEWNESLHRVGGWTAADVLGHQYAMFFSGSNPDLPQPDALLAEARRTGSIETEGWRLKRDGSRFWGDSVITVLPDEDGAARGFIVVMRDMTERKRMEERLVQLATVDPLTGAFNRRHGLARLGQEMDRRARSGHPLAVLSLDIDWFKRVNDSYGHDKGDVVLCELVRICKAELRTMDMLARWGGEEFLILLPETDEKAAFLVAERIRQAVAAARISAADMDSIAITISIGVAVATDADIDTLLRRADGALYAAKAAGKNQVISAP